MLNLTELGLDCLVVMRNCRIHEYFHICSSGKNIYCTKEAKKYKSSLLVIPLFPETKKSLLITILKAAL
jgi:hypothetical protein